MNCDPQYLRDLVEKNDDEANEIIMKNLEDVEIHSICFPHGETLLHFAAGCNNVTICNYLINDKHIIINMTNARGATALYYAVIKDAHDAVDVLLYNGADPRIKSGFSGMFPYQVAKSDIVKEMLAGQEHMVPLNYDNDCKRKQNTTLYHTYRYRLHRYWLCVLINEYLKQNGLQPIEGNMIIPEAQHLLANGGFPDILEKYKHVFVHFMFNITTTNETSCLYCNAETNTHKCSKCKKVYFCNKQCQYAAHVFHKMDCS